MTFVTFWRVETMAAIFQADIWCDDCAEKIKDDAYAGRFDHQRGMSRDDWEVEHGFDDERNYDSDEYPKWCDDEAESDCPQHCAGCSEFLGNDLTADGIEYVKDAVREDIESGRTDSIAVTEWMPFYDWIDFDGIGECSGCSAVRCELNEDYLCPDCAEKYYV
jgi:hypothetical protein